MTPDRISQLIEARFGEPAVVSEFRSKSWFIDEKTKQSWRDHLLSVFQHRLIGAEARGVSASVIEETERFLRQVEQLTPEHTLCTFSASSITSAYAGWIINDQIAFCIASKK
jgi:hypothetical protein